MNEPSFALLDSCAVCQIGQYHALYKVLGQAKFDKLFSHQTGSPLILSSYNVPSNPLLPFLDRIVTEKGTLGNRRVAVGQVVGFKNVEAYKAKHQLMGEDASLWAVCLQNRPDHQSYVMLGLNPEGMNEVEIEEQLLNDYNKPPQSCEALSDTLVAQILPSGREPNLAACALMKSPTDENKARFVRVLRQLGVSAADAAYNMKLRLAFNQPLTRQQVNLDFGLENSVIDFNIDLIEELVRRPLDQVSMDFVRAYPKP